MAEPSTTATAVITTGIGLASFLPAIDGNALIGAFAGATLFVMHSKELGKFTRFIYLLISLIMGYLLVPVVQAYTPIAETALAGFVASLFCITIALKGMEQIQSANLINLLRGKSK
ncbi:MAG: hypothetical protein OFPI_00260 [Osedax symbiont Rs2]|nr:MAG: hypothetical protein OFPI_00260 [Osedax symbiont Rs2]